MAHAASVNGSILFGQSGRPEGVAQFIVIAPRQEKARCCNHSQAIQHRAGSQPWRPLAIDHIIQATMARTRRSIRICVKVVRKCRNHALADTRSSPSAQECRWAGSEAGLASGRTVCVRRSTRSAGRRGRERPERSRCLVGCELQKRTSAIGERRSAPPGSRPESRAVPPSGISASFRA